MHTLQIFICALLALASPAAFADPGLAIEFVQGAKKDYSVLSYASFFVEPGQSPAASLEPGPFTCEVSGSVSVDLRAQYSFAVEAIGSVALLINGKEVLALTNSTGTQERSKPIRLTKGTNALVARYASNPNGPAMLRILWASKDHAVPIPIPAAALSHVPSPELSSALAIRKGAFLVEQYRCTKCHDAEPATRSKAFDAPSLEGIGSRLQSEWLAQFILDPSAHREAHMPRIFSGEDAEEKANAVASYLLERSGAAAQNAAPAPADNAKTLQDHGATLFQDLRCVSCHTAPGESEVAGRFSLKHVREKFVSVEEFLRNPQAHYPANPMPNFRLSQDEARAIAAFLVGTTPQVTRTTSRSSPRADGKTLLQTSGCLNCHTLDLPNQFTSPSLKAVMQSTAEAGCLSNESSKAPRFAFASGEKEHIQQFLRSRNSPVASQFTAREKAIHYADTLRCTQCHQDSGLPDPASLGGKLKPTWTKQFISGEISYKPRPWLKTRMPAFPAYAHDLATGLASAHGIAPSTAEPHRDPTLVAVGAKLISADGGFACVACHAVGSNSGAQVVESPGVNFAYSGDRLLPDFFHRWVMNPIAIEPSTKMPAYFDAEARSQLTEFLDGDAHRQIEAMRQFIRFGIHDAPPGPK